MNELGHMLREAREAQGLTLAQAEDRTRIRQKFIAAMEAEDWHSLPGDVTTRGFLRKYAAFLGLDPEEIVGHYQQRSNVSAPQPEVDQAMLERPVDYRPIELALAEESPRRVPWRGLVLLLVLGAAAVAVWWVVAFRPAWVGNLVTLPQNLPQPGDLIALEPTATPSPTALVNRVTATPTNTPEPTAPPVATAPPAVEIEATEDLAAQTPAPLDLMHLRLNVIARAWTRLMIDGQLVTESIMEQGSEGEWEALESIVLRTGNAAGVKVSLNGEDLPSLGGPGEVVERRWDLVDGVIVETTPTALPSPSPTETSEDGAAETPEADATEAAEAEVTETPAP